MESLISTYDSNTTTQHGLGKKFIVLANEYYNKCEYTNAKRCCDYAIKCNAARWQFHFTLGRVYCKLGKLEDAIKCTEKSISLLPSTNDCNNNNDNHHYLRNYRALAFYYGKIHSENQAIETLKICLNHVKSDKEKRDVYYWLGSHYKNTGDYLKAIENYQQCKIYDMENDEQYWNYRIETLKLHCINNKGSSSGGNNTIKNAKSADDAENAPPPPLKYIEKLYDKYSNYFDESLASLSYQTPTLCLNLLVNVCEVRISKPLFFQVGVDLGCGTGLSGIQFKPICKKLIGIDLSKGMIDKAKQRKNIYDSCYVSNIESILDEQLNTNKLSSIPIDLCISCDVFVYFKELDCVFDKVYKCLADGGIFVFSTEALLISSSLSSQNINGLTPIPPYQLQKTGRFKHHVNYIVNLLKEYKFNLLKWKEKEILRKQAGKPVYGNIFVAMK